MTHPTKAELLEKYGTREPQELFEVSADVVGFGDSNIDGDGHTIGYNVVHELLSISSGLRVYIPRGLGDREVVALLRKIADGFETMTLQQIYKAITDRRTKLDEQGAVEDAQPQTKRARKG